LRAPMGRRRPFMLIFFPLCAVFLMVTPLAGAVPAAVKLPAVVACIFLFTVFYNIAFDPYQALLPDITPEYQRGRVMAFWALLGVLGQAGVLLLPLPLDMKFYVVAGVMLLTVLLTCNYTREPSPNSFTRSEMGHLAEIRTAIQGLRILKQARL